MSDLEPPRGGIESAAPRAAFSFLRSLTAVVVALIGALVCVLHRARSAVRGGDRRGVGMDAVKGFIEAEGGRIEIHFTDQPVAPADFRTFELVILLPRRFAFSSGDGAHSPDRLPDGPASLLSMS